MERLAASSGRPDGRRRRAARRGRSLVPRRPRRRPLRDRARRAAARAADGRDDRRDAAHPREAGRGLAAGVEARPVEARPAAVRGRPARVRRQAGQGPAAPAGRTASRAAPAGDAGRLVPQLVPLPPRDDATRAREQPSSPRSRSCRPPRSRHGRLPAAAHGAQLLARGAVPGPRRAAARPRGHGPGGERHEPRPAGPRAPGAARPRVAVCRGRRVRPAVVGPLPETVRCALWSTAWEASAA